MPNLDTFIDTQIATERRAVQRTPGRYHDSGSASGRVHALRYSGSQCADMLAKSIGSPTTLRGVRKKNV